jgi:hypothetical protein
MFAFLDSTKYLWRAKKKKKKKKKKGWKKDYGGSS